MLNDNDISRAEIEANVSKVPGKPESSLDTDDTVAADKQSESSSPPSKSERESLPARVARLESDYQAVKSEIQDILLDLREKYLDSENPFSNP
jgi:hypothetical protein